MKTAEVYSTQSCASRQVSVQLEVSAPQERVVRKNVLLANIAHP